MRMILAIAMIMAVWSTTPLGIQWSNESLTPYVALFLRMAVASLVGLLLLALLSIRLSWTPAALKLYSASLIGVFGAMTFTYVSARYIPSGMISVMFALSPVLSSLYTYALLRNQKVSYVMLPCAVAMAGLAIIFADDWVLKGDGWMGLAFAFIAVNLYSFGGVLVQRQAVDQHPLATTVGTLILSLPLLAIAWFCFDGVVPKIDIASRSFLSVMYLALFGSLIGFACYFYVVSHRGAVTVAMITLVTPIFALVLGSTLNHETLSAHMVAGCACVLLGLLLYYRGQRWSSNQ